MNEDGSMARVPDLIRFCKKHGLLMVSVAALAQYRFAMPCRRIAGNDRPALVSCA
jgi:3,4-dihydroxy-2-butanone 4-phosphate synthase